MRARRYGFATVFTIAGTMLLCCCLSLVQCAAVVPFGTTPGPAVPVPVVGVVVATDGVTLSVTSPDRPCDDGVEVTSAESPTRVTLYATAYPDTSKGCALLKTPEQLVIRSTTRLQAPLGVRSIVDGQSGDPLPVFDERHAYRFAPPLTDWAPATEVTVVRDFGGSGALTLGQGYTRSGSRDLLWLVQTTGTWAPPATVVPTPVTVRGRAGRAAPGIVVWVENGYTLAIRWDTEPWHLPGTDQLLALAAALVPGEAG